MTATSTIDLVTSTPHLVSPFKNGVGLSERETDIVRLIASGQSNEEIGDTLFLSVNTVKSYIRSAYRRMGVHTRARAVIWAFDHALVVPQYAAANGRPGV